MNLIIDHLEYLLRRHDCVIVPGIGALMVRYRAARFDSRNNSVILPPTRELAFNGMLIESDGVIEQSVARRNGISFEAASRIVAEEAEGLLQQLKSFGSISLGHLGELTYSEYNTVIFTPSKSSDWDITLYGLRPLYLKTAEYIVNNSTPDVRAGSVENDNKTLIAPPMKAWQGETGVSASREHGKITRAIVGVAASLALIITLALFFINPIKVDNEPLKASIAPVLEENITGEIADKGIVEDKDLNESDLARETVITPNEEVASSAKPESDKIETNAAKDLSGKQSAPAETELRFNNSDPFCVIVASFPDEAQAQRYILENKNTQLGVLNQDGKFRIYAATGSTYEEAAAQKSSTGCSGAWVCRR